GRRRGHGGSHPGQLRAMRCDHREGRPPHPAGGRFRARIHPHVIPTRDDVLAAREALGDRLHRTPIFSSATLSRLTGARVFVKAELFQRTGSFKPRGILYKVDSLSAEEKGRGVISISAGNAAQAVAWAAAEVGADALVVMWQGASEQKIE